MPSPFGTGRCTGKGFRTISVGRRGAALTAGEDSELIYCLRLAGWRVWVEPRLGVRHFLPARRLQWDYARRLAYWSAYATAERDALVYACKPPRHGLSKLARRVREGWAWQCMSAAWRLATMSFGFVKARRSTSEGDPDVLRLELVRGRLQGLLSARTWYGRRSSEVRHVMTRNAHLDLNVTATLGEEIARA